MKKSVQQFLFKGHKYLNRVFQASSPTYNVHWAGDTHFPDSGQRPDYLKEQFE